jgi:histone H2A
VFTAAVLEYLCAEILELAGNAARDNNRHRIIPRHILLAIACDDELNKLLKGVTVSQGGVLPHIHNVLLHQSKAMPKANKRKSGLPAAKASVPTPSKRNLKIATPRKQRGKPVAKGGRKGKQGGRGATTPGQNTTVLNEKTLPLGQKLTVIKGNILDVNAEAYVHPTNSSLNLAGQVGMALRSKGGAALEAAIRKARGGIAVSEAVISGSGDLPLCDHVIHVNSPSWDPIDGVEQLKDAVTNVMGVADANDLKSVAFPSIASGANNFPKHTAAQTILRAIKGYLANKTDSSLEQV